jgi:hypothetical protein
VSLCFVYPFLVLEIARLVFLTVSFVIAMLLVKENVMSLGLLIGNCCGGGFVLCKFHKFCHKHLVLYVQCGGTVCLFFSLSPSYSLCDLFREKLSQCHCPPQIPHGLTRAQTHASVARGWRLTTWAMAWPRYSGKKTLFLSEPCG